MLSAPTPHISDTTTVVCPCPECDGPWDDELQQASAWLGAGARLEGFCECGSFLVWEQQPDGRWTLANAVAPS